MPSRTYFISDIHLRPAGAPGAEEHAEHFYRFLSSVVGDARGGTPTVYVLGDLFDFWFEPGGGAPYGFEAHYTRLREAAAAGMKIVVLPGNRDFLMGSGFRQVTGAQLAPGEMHVELGGMRICLMHGDILMRGDKRYREWHRLSRGATFRRFASSMPAWVGERVARAIRRGSEVEKRAKPPAARELSEAYLRSRLVGGADVIIAGHLHESRDTVLEYGSVSGRLIVLGTWDHGRGAYAEFDGTSLALRE